MSGDRCTIKRELAWSLSVLSEVVYARYNGNLSLPAWEDSEKSSASFDHCSSYYQIDLLDLALQDSREETEADK